MVKIGLIQTKCYPTNEKGITIISNKIRELGKKEIDIVCLPEQWLKNNLIDDGDKEFLEFKKIAKEFTMTVIPGAFFNKMKKNTHIISPVIGPEGEFIRKQEKIHPFEDEKNKVKLGNEVKIFNTTCKFGIIICYDYP